jgi:hypothetical protein
MPLNAWHRTDAASACHSPRRRCRRGCGPRESTCRRPRRTAAPARRIPTGSRGEGASGRRSWFGERLPPVSHLSPRTEHLSRQPGCTGSTRRSPACVPLERRRSRDDAPGPTAGPVSGSSPPATSAAAHAPPHAEPSPKSNSPTPTCDPQAGDPSPGWAGGPVRSVRSHDLRSTKGGSPGLPSSNRPPCGSSRAAATAPTRVAAGALTQLRMRHRWSSGGQLGSHRRRPGRKGDVLLMLRFSMRG